MRKRDGEFIVPSCVCHTLFAQTKPPATVYTGYFNRCGRKKNVKDKSNLLLINKLKIEANTIADKLGKI